MKTLFFIEWYIWLILAIVFSGMMWLFYIRQVDCDYFIKHYNENLLYYGRTIMPNEQKCIFKELNELDK